MDFCIHKHREQMINLVHFAVPPHEVQDFGGKLNTTTDVSCHFWKAESQHECWGLKDFHW